MTNMIARGASLAVAGFVLFGASVDALAEPRDRYERQVLTELDEWRDVLGRDGYRKTHNYFTDKINRGRSGYYRIDLDRNKDYALTVVCDSDCSDVDMRVVDDNNAEVGVDVEPDDIPLVYITPRWSGEFEIEVTVPGCTARRCTVGVGIFGK